jgi:hypothetical protein
MKLINIRRQFAAIAFAASLTTGWMAVASAQGTGDTAHEGEDCPFADTEHASCRDASTTVTPQPGDDTPPPAEADLVVICHRPVTPAQKTLFVSSNAVSAHMAHGDTPGACGD